MLKWGLPVVPSCRVTWRERADQGRITPPGKHQSSISPASLKPSCAFSSSSSSRSCSTRTSPPPPQKRLKQHLRRSVSSERRQLQPGPHQHPQPLLMDNSPRLPILTSALTSCLLSPASPTAARGQPCGDDSSSQLPDTALDQLDTLGKHCLLPASDFVERVTRLTASLSSPLWCPLPWCQSHNQTSCRAGIPTQETGHSEASSSG